MKIPFLKMKKKQKPKPESPEPLIDKSSWNLESGRTVVFYNGNPSLDIVAGVKGRIIAIRPRLVYMSAFDRLWLDTIFPKSKREYYNRNLLVLVGEKLIEVSEDLVRVIEPPKKKKKKK